MSLPQQHGENRNKAFLGTGLAFPVQVDSRGEITLVSNEQDIEQAIRIILGTRRGERVMRPDFGCRVHELLFEPRDATTASLVRSYVQDALSFWEPRIQLVRVETYLDNANDGAILVEIEYLVKATHDRRSIVYPFEIVLGEEE
jgi:phage baseplate assembly protein W